MNMKLAVIGAGLPRTGTLSMKEALEILYPEGPCYHMTVFLRDGNSKDTEHWHKAMSGKATKEDWYKFFDKGGFRTAVDYPASYFYKELFEAYPEAKVVLTVRDVQSWHESCYSTIFNNHENQKTPWIYYLTGLAQRFKVTERIGNLIVPGFSVSFKDTNKSGPEASKVYFDKWTEEVKNNIPEKQLLIFDVRQGWAPLCKFLDRPIPDVPFPKANDRKTMKKKISTVKILGWSVSFGIIGIISGLLYYIL
uniref:Sulfotransferase family protein n=1 Tax=Lepeophtheirus salmonis TaxID=72036 RepID=A0A0K2TZF1_LEPSM